MGYSRRTGVPIHYELHGSGPAILLVHANPFDRRLWSFQQAWLAERFRVISIDLRGYGRSGHDGTDFDLRDLMDDVVGVCETEGVDRAVLAGASVGSGIVLLTALERPDLAQALVLVGGSSNGPARVDAIVEDLLSAEREGRLEEHLTARRHQYTAPGFPLTQEGRALLDRFDGGVRSAAVIAQFYRARAACPLAARLQDLSLPVLVVNGEHDVSLAAGRRTADSIAGAEHVVIADTGHICCLEDPSTFNTAVEAYLDGHGLLPERRAVSG